jgi:hypothetical protein
MVNFNIIPLSNALSFSCGSCRSTEVSQVQTPLWHSQLSSVCWDPLQRQEAENATFHIDKGPIQHDLHTSLLYKRRHRSFAGARLLITITRIRVTAETNHRELTHSRNVSCRAGYERSKQYLMSACCVILIRFRCGCVKCLVTAWKRRLTYNYLCVFLVVVSTQNLPHLIIQ